MTLHLTPEMLAAAYDYLRTTQPFVRWKLPDSDDVAFIVSRHPSVMGQVSIFKDTITVEISGAIVGHTSSLMSVMAHEMIHVHQKDTRAETPNAMHNAAFKRDAARVCKYHGFDPKLF